MIVFSHASAGVNALDGVYAALVAFVLSGVFFAVLRVMPRPRWMRSKSHGMRNAKIAGVILLFAGALAFGAVYTGLVNPQADMHSAMCSLNR